MASLLGLGEMNSFGISTSKTEWSMMISRRKLPQSPLLVTSLMQSFRIGTKSTPGAWVRTTFSEIKMTRMSSNHSQWNKTCSKARKFFKLPVAPSMSSFWHKRMRWRACIKKITVPLCKLNQSSHLASLLKKAKKKMRKKMAQSCQNSL